MFVVENMGSESFAQKSRSPHHPGTASVVGACSLLLCCAANARGKIPGNRDGKVGENTSSKRLCVYAPHKPV